VKQREAYWQVQRLAETLEKIVTMDPEQEVMGIALPVLDATLSAARDFLPHHPVVTAAQDVISADAIAMGEPIRAIDAYLVARQLAEALHRAEFHFPEVDGTRLAEVNDSLRRESGFF
jgi:hypothetical protein